MNILISGSSRGIGRYLAEHFASQGHAVFGCSRGSATWEHERYVHFSVDICDEGAVRAMLAAIRKRSGGLGALVNNAAVNPAIAPAMLTSLASVRATFETNVFATMLLSREAAKLMAPARFGRIVNMSSMAARHHVAGESSYTASKAAVEAFTRVFAKEVNAFGITVNAVAPSAVPTDLSRAIDPAALRDVLRRNAIPEPGSMEDVSNVVDWLLRAESSAVTGQVLYLGGV